MLRLVLLLTWPICTTQWHFEMGEDSSQDSPWLTNGVRTLQECQTFMDCDGSTACYIGCSADGYDGDLQSTSFTTSTYIVRTYGYQNGLTSVSTCESYCGRAQDAGKYETSTEDTGKYYWFFTRYGDQYDGSSLIYVLSREPGSWTPVYLSYHLEDSQLDYCNDACHARGVVDVDDDTTCSAGLNKEGAVAIDTFPFVEAVCTAVTCPAPSVGTDVASGCTCPDGYVGTVSPTLTDPWYSGMCEAVECPSNSNGVSVADGCSCEDGFTGEILATNVSPYYDGSCTEDYSAAFSPAVSSLVWLCGLMIVLL